MKILVALYMKFICPAVAQPPYSTWDKVILLGASTTYALKLKSSSKYLLFMADIYIALYSMDGGSTSQKHFTSSIHKILVQSILF